MAALVPRNHIPVFYGDPKDKTEQRKRRFAAWAHVRTIFNVLSRSDPAQYGKPVSIPYSTT